MNQRRITQKQKVEADRQGKSARKPKKQSFQEERLVKAEHIQPKNENQNQYLKSLAINAVSVGRGSAGTGKTYLAARVAANKFLMGEIDTIVVTRPLVGMGKGSGFWPGTIKEKLEPWLLPILNNIKDVIGNGAYEAEYGKGIDIQPMESVRGRSFDSRTFLIVDEAQNCTPDEIRSLVTRLEEGSQIAFCGDDAQKDIQGVSGIKYLCDLIKKHNLPNCGVVEFTSDDIVRSGLTKLFVKIFDQEGAAPK